MNRYLRDERETERLLRQLKSRSAGSDHGDDEDDKEPVAW